MTGRPGGLPLLQFALERLWGKQAGRELSVAAYAGADGTGGLRTALEEKAEQVLAALGPASEAGVRRVMLRLVRLGGEDAPDARAVAPRGEIGEADWPLVQRLARERLVMIATTGSGVETAEVAHEALIGGWSRLRDWLVAYRLFGLWRQRLGANLGQWSGAPGEAFLRGGLLAEALGWLASHADQLNARETAFIEASRDNAAREAEEDIRQARERERLAQALADAALKQERLAKGLADAALKEKAVADDLAETRRLSLEQATMASKRQRGFIAGLGAAVLLLVAALGIGWHFYTESQRQTERAETAATQAETAAEAERQARTNAETAQARATSEAQRAETAATQARTAAQAERQARAQADQARAAATRQASLAMAAAERADNIAREAKGRQLAAEAIGLQRDIGGAAASERAAALAIEGWRRLETSAAFEAVKTAWRELPFARVEHGDGVTAVAFSPDGAL